EARNEGTLTSVSDGIVRIHGLNDVMSGEMVELPGDTYALALNLERDSVGAVVLGKYEHLREGDTAKTTGRILEVPVGRELLGRVVDALGNPIDGKGPINAAKTSPVEKVAPGVIWRKSVSQPVQTGYKSIDSMIPIGKGQRELIVGDRQTGKTAVAVDTIINQSNKSVAEKVGMSEELLYVSPLNFVNLEAVLASEIPATVWNEFDLHLQQEFNISFSNVESLKFVDLLNPKVSKPNINLYDFVSNDDLILFFLFFYKYSSSSFVNFLPKIFSFLNINPSFYKNFFTKSYYDLSFKDSDVLETSFSSDLGSIVASTNKILVNYTFDLIAELLLKFRILTTRVLLNNFLTGQASKNDVSSLIALCYSLPFDFLRYFTNEFEELEALAALVGKDEHFGQIVNIVERFAFGEKKAIIDFTLNFSEKRFSDLLKVTIDSKSSSKLFEITKFLNNVKAASSCNILQANTIISFITTSTPRLLLHGD